MGKNNKKVKKNKEDEVLKYSLTLDEQEEIKIAVTAMGIQGAIMDGLQYAVRIKQSNIERRCNIPAAPEGFTNQTMLNFQTMELEVRRLRIPEPKAPEAPVAKAADVQPEKQPN